jgi:hypothetical protein
MMQPTDRAAFVRILNGLVAIKPGAKALTPEALTIWWNSMQDWSIADFEQAAAHLVRHSKFMPSPYEFEELRRAGELTASEAWTLALSGAELQPGCRAARAALIVGGQYAIRHANTERDLPHIERRFLDAYEQLADVDPAREM